MNKFSYDIASGLFLGQRTKQQDVVKGSGSTNHGISILALSDGMGGAPHGELASRMIINTVWSEVSERENDITDDPKSAPDILRNAAHSANKKIQEFTKKKPANKGMGGTLVLLILIDDKAYWVSIGDSLLFLLRNNNLIRLNADHSLASGLDNLVSLGKIDPIVAKAMAARSTLTSALMGEDLGSIDCPKEGYVIRRGDTILLASDGLQALNDSEIQDHLVTTKLQNSASRVKNLLSLVEAKNRSDQDNLSIGIAVVN